MHLIMTYQFCGENYSSYKTGDKEFEVRFVTEYFTHKIFVRSDFIEHLLPISQSEGNAVLKHHKLLLLQDEQWIPGGLVKEVLEKLVSGDDKNRMCTFLNWYTDIEKILDSCVKLQKYIGVEKKYSCHGLQGTAIIIALRKIGLLGIRK